MSDEGAVAFGMLGEIVRSVRFAGETVDAIVRADRAEHSRRARDSTPPVLDRDLLAALSSLPFGLPVRWDDIDPWERAVLSAAPTGLVRETPSGVMRLYRPVLRVEGVLITTAKRWQAAVTSAAWFWCDARRAVVLTGQQRDMSKAVARAERHGVGLGVLGGNEVNVLVPPADVSPVLGPRHWRFLEACYAAWIAQARIHADR